MKTALIIVDVQNDFLPGGSFAVENGDEIIPVINKLVKADFDIKVASKDWHPENHGSFAKNHNKSPGERVILKGLEQILWPEHCVQNTPGADFSSSLDTDRFEKLFFKGTDKDIDSYSTFFDNGHQKSTGLDEYLKNKKVTDVFIAGLTTDYCVKFSVLDAINLGFRVHVIEDGCKAINLKKNDGQNALKEMKERGAEITTAKEVLEKIRSSGI